MSTKLKLVKSILFNFKPSREYFVIYRESINFAPFGKKKRVKQVYISPVNFSNSNFAS